MTCAELSCQQLSDLSEPRGSAPDYNIMADDRPEPLIVCLRNEEKERSTAMMKDDVAGGCPLS